MWTPPPSAISSVSPVFPVPSSTCVREQYLDFHGREVLPNADARPVAVIQALDGTWHRPFTTLELAALQGAIPRNSTAYRIAPGASVSAMQ